MQDKDHVWAYLEAGKWDDAMFPADYLAGIAPADDDVLALARLTLGLATSSAAIQEGEQDPDTTKWLAELAQSWPRLGQPKTCVSLMDATNSQRQVPEGVPSPGPEVVTNLLPKKERDGQSQTA